MLLVHQSNIFDNPSWARSLKLRPNSIKRDKYSPVLICWNSLEKAFKVFDI